MTGPVLRGPTPILDAVYRRDAVALGQLLAPRPALTIFEAAAVGDAARIRALLTDDPGLAAAVSADGRTALHLAAHFGHGAAVEALLAGKADVRAWSTNSFHNQPLHAALAGRGDLRILTALLGRGAEVNAVEHGGYASLHLAASRDEPALVETLLSRGADPTARTDDAKTARMMAEQAGHGLVARRLRGEEP